MRSHKEQAMTLRREPIPNDLWQRRQQEKKAWPEFIQSLQPNYFLTLTFNDATPSTIGLGPLKGRRDLSAQGAERAINFFYKKMLRALLGPTWHERKERQPIAIAFLEGPSRITNSHGMPVNHQSTPHYHVHLTVPEDEIKKFEAIDLNALWRDANTELHRSAYMEKNTTKEQIVARSVYTLKQFTRAPIGQEYVILGANTHG